uniref:Uncharacterized protein n=1 Tax=Arundo donax TaxID=35708 RepID=A0A0A8YGN0_ARUDO
MLETCGSLHCACVCYLLLDLVLICWYDCNV